MNPPRIARWLLSLTVPACDRDDVVSNFDDLYRFRRDSRGRIAADAWYWLQALSFSAHIRIASPAPAGGSPRSTSRLGGTVSEFFEDVHFALRSYRKSPGFLLAVVGTLGLGFGANIVIFAVVNSAVLRPLQFPDPDALVWVWSGGNVSLTLGARSTSRCCSSRPSSPQRPALSAPRLQSWGSWRRRP